MIALVQNTLYAGVGVKVGTLPAILFRYVTVGVEYIIASKWGWLLEVVDKAYARHNNSEQCYHYNRQQPFKYVL